MCLWDSCSLELIESCVGPFFVSMIFRNVEDGIQWIFSGVYGPNDDYSRKILWDELVGVHSWWNLP